MPGLRFDLRDTPPEAPESIVVPDPSVTISVPSASTTPSGPGATRRSARK